MDDSVTGDEFGEDTTSGLDTESDRVDIDEDEPLSFFSTSQDTTVDGSTIGNGLIRADSIEGFLAVEPWGYEWSHQQGQPQ